MRIASILAAALSTSSILVASASPPIHRPLLAGLVQVGGTVSDSVASDSTYLHRRHHGGDKDVVRMGEDIEVAKGETVEGDVVAIGGRVTVYGHVLGDVVSVGGGIELHSGCVVNGDAVCVGGTLDREEGAEVHGQNVSVGVLPKGFSRWLPHRRFHEGGIASPFATWVGVWWSLMRMAGVFAVGLIFYLALPQRMTMVRGGARSHFWLSLLVGFASMIGAMIGLVLLAITCIGIPFAILGALLYVVAAIACAALVVSLLGEVLMKRSAHDTGSFALALLVGLVPLFVVRVIDRVFGGMDAGGLGAAIHVSFRVVGNVAWAVFVMVGLGSLILTRFGTQPHSTLATAAAPPLPAAPPPPPPPIT